MAAVFSYALLHDGQVHTRGTNHVSDCDTVAEFARWIGNRPYPRPVDVVQVWAGDRMVTEPDLVHRRRRLHSLPAVAS